MRQILTTEAKTLSTLKNALDKYFSERGINNVKDCEFIALNIMWVFECGLFTHDEIYEVLESALALHDLGISDESEKNSNQM